MCFWEHLMSWMPWGLPFCYCRTLGLQNVLRTGNDTSHHCTTEHQWCLCQLSNYTLSFIRGSFILVLDSPHPQVRNEDKESVESYVGTHCKIIDLQQPSSSWCPPNLAGLQLSSSPANTTSGKDWWGLESTSSTEHQAEEGWSTEQYHQTTEPMWIMLSTVILLSFPPECQTMVVRPNCGQTLEGKREPDLVDQKNLENYRPPAPCKLSKGECM